MPDMNEKLERVEEMVEDIHKRLFIGNGKPSLTTLIDRHDQQLAALRWTLGVVVVAVLGVVVRVWVSP